MNSQGILEFNWLKQPSAGALCVSLSRETEESVCLCMSAPLRFGQELFSKIVLMLTVRLFIHPSVYQSLVSDKKMLNLSGCPLGLINIWTNRTVGLLVLTRNCEPININSPNQRTR